MLLGLAPVLIHRSTLASLLREHTTEGVRVGVHVGVEGRYVHEQHEDHGTDKGEGHVVAKKATPLVTALERLIRRSAS